MYLVETDLSGSMIEISLVTIAWDFGQGKFIEILLGAFKNDFEAQEGIILYVGGAGGVYLRHRRGLWGPFQKGPIIRAPNAANNRNW